MIEIDVQPFTSQIFQIEFACPHCGIKAIFFYHPKRYCEYCHAALPNITSLFDEGGGRMWYHKTGKVLETDARMDKVLVQHIGKVGNV